eukprot:CAMPEP_0185783764 /NCGR_PEP_ID=MMETSP1174-20130828/118893_1 /TAXON_ID=35687 /ORGANISM="Dictyocha speculum, Strain CCMP1381" /LENGTH=97 /DNA_ID=CAMNT_0028474967 /DNA_START=92 /DNA_END=385 /DNA_ORIENTATION=-
MIETAQFVSNAAGAAAPDKVVVFTGAMKPQKMTDSDAGFNVGAAVGAMNFLAAGVYVCMGGRIFEASRVTRNEVSGLFIPKESTSAQVARSKTQDSA